MKDIVIQVNLNLDKVPYTNTKKSKYIDTYKVLVNKYNYLDKDYKPSILVKLNNCSINNQYVDSKIVNDFNDLCNAIKSNNLNIRVISSYRSYKYQEKLYYNYVKKDGINNADTYSARPGFSEHQTGLAIDIDDGIKDYNNFESTDSYNWMINNSYKYGFILRYPYGKENITLFNFESWHYRYVGKDIAKYIFDNGITFDEYYVKYIEK